MAFDTALSLEFGDPAFFAVHHLTVAAYQVQHPRAHPSSGAMDVLRRFLDEGVAPAQMRREIIAGRVGTDGGSERAAVAGAMRLSSVRLHDAAVYCGDIERYARSVLAASGSRGRSEPDR